MQFEWDEKKKRLNFKKHKISFSDIKELFLGPMLEFLDEKHDDAEERWIGIGKIGKEVLVVVYTEVAENHLRIISARKASAHEKQKFYEHVKNRLE